VSLPFESDTAGPLRSDLVGIRVCRGLFLKPLPAFEVDDDEEEENEGCCSSNGHTNYNCLPKDAGSQSDTAANASKAYVPQRSSLSVVEWGHLVVKYSKVTRYLHQCWEWMQLVVTSCVKGRREDVHPQIEYI
jgi:hypothetical protein